tara:strand:+ start:123 stop:866 length:744 start_codon:yes stop_codon:yes gene_type:complete
MNNIQNATKYWLGAGAIIFTFLISQSGFKDGKPTCNNYVINVYLYLALSLLILGLFSTAIPWEKAGTGLTILTIIFSFITIIFIAFSNNFQKNISQVIRSHLYWILFIIAISGTFWMYFVNYKEYITDAIINTALIFTFMSLLVYIKPSFFINTYSQIMAGLLIALTVIIITELYYIFFTTNYTTSETHKIISYILITIFSVFVSYDTSRVFVLAKQCHNYPNYPKSSISLFLDVLNLFSNLLQLQN